MASSSSKRIIRSKEVLGTGGFGTVFKGTFHNKTVAVKRMLIEQVDEREEEFLKKYPHPYILKLFHVEQDDNFRQVIDPN